MLWSLQLHHVSVGVGQYEGRPDAAGRAIAPNR